MFPILYIQRCVSVRVEYFFFIIFIFIFLFSIIYYIYYIPLFFFVNWYIVVGSAPLLLSSSFAVTASTTLTVSYVHIVVVVVVIVVIVLVAVVCCCCSWILSLQVSFFNYVFAVKNLNLFFMLVCVLFVAVFSLMWWWTKKKQQQRAFREYTDKNECTNTRRQSVYHRCLSSAKRHRRRHLAQLSSNSSTYHLFYKFGPQYNDL